MTFPHALKVGLALLSLSSPIFAGPPTLSLLERSREFIKFPEYSLAQRKTVFTQAKLIINEIYINKDLKIKDFGADPTIALKSIEDRIETMSIDEFHSSMSAIFDSFRDRHTLYYFPRPFACYESYLPMNLRDAQNEKGQQVIIVNSLITSAEQDRLLKTPLSIGEGDVLISYNGKPIEEALRERMPKSGGANESAARRLSVFQLGARNHNLSLLPEANSVKITFKKRNGKVYTQDVPWIVKKDWSCLTTNDQESALPKLKTFKGIKAKDSEDEAMFRYKIISNQFGDFGYLKISSFSSGDMTAAQVVNRFKEILRDEFAETDGLIIDMRYNLGGDSTIAERFVQLVSPKRVAPLTDFMKVTSPNFHYMETVMPNDSFTESLRTARSQGEAFTVPLALISEDQTNDIGQFYFKPVAVFTDGICYSSCDMLSAQLQDHELATIFGEDKTTGGGGANVFKLSKFLGDLGSNKGPFKPLPAGQDIDFAFRQTVRNGINAGKLIENEGVKADYVLPVTVSDLYLDDAEHFMKIGNFLSEKSLAYNSRALMTEERVDFVQNKKASVKLTWQETSKIRFEENKTALGSKDIAHNGDSLIPLPIDTKTVRSGRMELFGSDGSKDVWRKILNYRIVPAAVAVKVPYSLDLKNMSFYTYNSRLSDGWQVKGNSLVLGKNSRYQDLLHAEASIFVKVSEKMFLNYKARLQTEVDCDILKVIVKSEGKETILVEGLSGSVPLKEFKASLEAFKGKDVEIRFVFGSDEMINDSGVLISDIRLSAI